EKEWRIVGHGRDIEGIVPGKRSGIIAPDKLGKCIRRRSGGRVQEFQIRISLQMPADRFLFRRRERTLLRQNGNWNSVFIQITVRDDDKMSRCVSLAYLMYRLHSD